LIVHLASKSSATLLLVIIYILFIPHINPTYFTLITQGDDMVLKILSEIPQPTESPILAWSSTLSVFCLIVIEKYLYCLSQISKVGVIIELEGFKGLGHQLISNPSASTSICLMMISSGSMSEL